MGLTFSISANAELEIDTLHFQIIYDGPGDNGNDGNGIPRTPVVPPSAAIDGHTFKIKGNKVVLHPGTTVSIGTKLEICQ